MSHEDLSTLTLQTTPVLVVGIAQAVIGVMYLLMVRLVFALGGDTVTYPHL